MKHTSGPWIIEHAYGASKEEQALGLPRRFCYFDIRAGSEGIANVNSAYGTVELQNANARLIAAAPEMLETIEELLEEIGWVEGLRREAREAEERAIALVKKIRGES